MLYPLDLISPFFPCSSPQAWLLCGTGKSHVLAVSVSWYISVLTGKAMTPAKAIYHQFDKSILGNSWYRCYGCYTGCLMLSSCLEGGNHLIPITGNGHVDGGGAECPFPKWPLRPRPEKKQGWEGGTCSLESYKSAQDSSRRGSSVISESRLIDDQKAKELPESMLVQ